MVGESQTKREASQRKSVRSFKKTKAGKFSRALANRHLAAKLLRIDISGRLAKDGERSDLAQWTNNLESAPFYEIDLLADPTPEVVRIGAMATALTRAWDEIEKELESSTSLDARAAKLDLANHTWCDLIIALVQFIEQARKALDDLRKRLATSS